MKIIDISHHDTHEDLTKYDGVIIKAEEGVNCPDESLDSNVAAARSAGKPFGLYHYLSFRSDVNAQIAEFKAALAKYPDTTLRPALDVEFDDRINQTLPADINDRIKAFQSAVDGIMLYANPDMLGKLNASVCGALPLWQAEYNPKPRDISGYTRIGWQYREDPDESDFTEAVMLLGVAPPAPAPAPVPTIPQSDPMVLSHQQTLNRLHIRDFLGNVLAEDGIAGDHTDQAIRNLQTVCGIGVDGEWGTQTQGVIDAILAKPMLKRGCSGIAVRYIQSQIGGVDVDGDFGPATEAHVCGWQANVGIGVDGIFGSQSWDKMIG